jgi:site-specific DNA-methyltransferase (adenine-specific)
LIGTVAENVLQHGTGAINVDGCRVGTEERTTNWSGTANYKVSDPKIGTTTALGRWPANFIHDGSEEVVGLFPETGASRAIKGGANRRAYREHEITNPSGWKEVGRIRKDEGYDDAGGSAARFFYCAKASKRDRDEGNHHPTVKPTDLMRYLCRLVTPPEGIVLDPFMGSGSTGKAAVLEGFRFIGIEREENYIEIAEARINSAKALV